VQCGAEAIALALALDEKDGLLGRDRDAHFVEVIEWELRPRAGPAIRR